MKRRPFHLWLAQEFNDGLSYSQRTMTYRRGCANADALSRLPLPDIPAVTPMRMEIINFMSAKNIRVWTQKDTMLSIVFKYVRNGWPQFPKNDTELRPFSNRKPEFSTQKGVILWANRVVVPPQRYSQVLQELHSSHSGIVRMKAIARSYVSERVHHARISVTVFPEQHHIHGNGQTNPGHRFT